MKNSELIYKISSLLKDEETLINDLIIETIEQVASSSLSVEAHSKKVERMIDRKIKEFEGVKT